MPRIMRVMSLNLQTFSNTLAGDVFIAMLCNEVRQPWFLASNNIS